MSNQPDALRLAEWFEGGLGGCELEAAELRRLVAEHEEDQRVIAVWRGRTQRAEAQRERLLEALRWIASVNATDREYQAKARAAIKVVEGEKE